MEVTTKGKFIRVSPLKARAVANEVRGKNALEALAVLKFMPQGPSKVISKVLRTAIADAEHNFLLDSKELTISKITVDKGPYFKRIQPAARGSVHGIQKKTSHISITVSGETKIKKIKKEELPKNEEVKKEPVAKETTETKEQKPAEVKQVKEEKFKPEEKRFDKNQGQDQGFRRFFRRKSG